MLPWRVCWGLRPGGGTGNVHEPGLALRLLGVLRRGGHESGTLVGAGDALQAVILFHVLAVIHEMASPLSMRLQA